MLEQALNHSEIRYGKFVYFPDRVRGGA